MALDRKCKCGRSLADQLPQVVKCEPCAETVVLRVRGSNDVPGFDSCVRAEMEADLG